MDAAPVSPASDVSDNEAGIAPMERPPGDIHTLPHNAKPRRETEMLHYAVVFFIIAIVAAILGFGGIAAGAAGIAKVLFFVFLVLAILTFLRRA
jgi:uncharacterized membrane protein YtjA (UPF0391 family)